MKIQTSVLAAALLAVSFAGDSVAAGRYEALGQLTGSSDNRMPSSVADFKVPAPDAVESKSGLPANVKAFLELIAHSELKGCQSYLNNPKGGYNIRFGCGTLSSLGKHPGMFRISPKSKKKSSMAGRYQFKFTTWNSLMGGNAAFSPANQDKAAAKLLQQIGAYSAALSGNLEKAIRKARGTWPSLPGGSQQKTTMQEAKKVYNKVRNSL